VREGLDHVDPRGRDMLMRRYGWGGDPPKTLADASQALGVTVMRGALIERAAIRSALAARRATV
jgi:DNA-directed RNA polymerase sigma subunit (sigma70/sigma32)